METIRTDCLVIGSGLAGAAYAYHAARLGHDVALVSANGMLTGANSDWAQGGIIYEEGFDGQKLAEDIMTASDGTANPEAIDCLLRHGPAAVKSLLLDELSVPFDREAGGGLKFTREGGHSEKRIIFSKDATGHGILGALHARIEKEPRINRHEGQVAIDLLTLSHNSVEPQHKYRSPTGIGAYVLDLVSGKTRAFIAKKTILATGGIGQVYLHTTNQPGTVGHGIAMAYRVGARVIDLEYVQFHPTVFFKKGHPRFLVSEALRGEGAVLVNSRGERFLEAQHPRGSLAPRDIVSRCIHHELVSTGETCVYLDLAALSADFVRERFPNIHRRCLDCGVDITREPIPVVPAAHYLCGGIWTDLHGRTTIRNLNAIGETAGTGLHGANRLASTSLLECLTSAQLTAEADHTELDRDEFLLPDVKTWETPKPNPDPVLIEQDMQLIRNTMWNYVGLIRSPRRLARARRLLLELREEVIRFYAGYRLTRGLIDLRNAVQTALLVVHAASLNPRSKGSHYITPDPER